MQLIDRCGECSGSCTRKKSVAGRTGQVESRGQRADGLDLGPFSFTTLERTDGMDRQTRDRGEFLLREARGLSKRLESSAK